MTNCKVLLDQFSAWTTIDVMYRGLPEHTYFGGRLADTVGGICGLVKI